MALEAERLRLTPDQAGTYHIQLALCDGAGLDIAQEYAIVVQEL
jgi:hypothetical protein